ncbi:MAG TPA: hypothetical protein VKZ60_11090 [Chloroflexota bacterium]|nr:hypothetical protein [Chloroflexota bacterium]
MVKVSSVYRYYQRLAPHDAGARARAALFAPPCRPYRAGRWLALALLGGGGAWLVAGLAAVWLVLGLCLGVMGEIALLFEHEHRRASLQPALDRWLAAYYCGTHDCVLLPEPDYVCAPEAFASLLHHPAPGYPSTPPHFIRTVHLGRS